MTSTERVSNAPQEQGERRIIIRGSREVESYGRRYVGGTSGIPVPICNDYGSGGTIREVGVVAEGPVNREVRWHEENLETYNGCTHILQRWRGTLQTRMKSYRAVTVPEDRNLS